MGSVVRGELDRAVRIRAERPDLELTDDDKEDLPRWASAGEAEIVERLLNAGIPIDARGVDDGTALHYAGMWGRATTLKLLLARGAEVDRLGGMAPRAARRWAGPPGARATSPARPDRPDDYFDAVKVLLDARRAGDRGHDRDCVRRGCHPAGGNRNRSSRVKPPHPAVLHCAALPNLEVMRC